MSVPLYEQVYQYLLNEVRSGRLKSGDRVPSEKELAEQFHVSRITSKKALENLMQARVVERIRGKGTFVAEELPDLDHMHSILLEEVPAVSHQGHSDQLLIGLILEDFSASYGLHLLQAIEDRCSQRHMHMLMKRSYGRREEEEEAIHNFLHMGVDGLIVFPVHGDYYNPKLLKLVVDEFPLVLVDRYLKGIAAHCVYTDNRKAAFDLTNYVIDKGHTHIAFLSPPLENTSSIDDRLQGFTAALAGRGVQLNQHYCYTTLSSSLSAGLAKEHIHRDQKALEQFLQQHPQITAFFACEFDMAQLLRHTLQVIDPHRAAKVDIVCFDYTERLFDEPPLFTHVQQDEVMMGHMAVDGLFALLKGQSMPLQTVIPYTIVHSGKA